jgi:hypothetical protein
MRKPLDGGVKPQNNLHGGPGIGTKRKIPDSDRNGKHPSRKTHVIDDETMNEPSINTSEDEHRASRKSRRSDEHRAAVRDKDGQVVPGSRNGTRSKATSEDISSPPTLSSSSVTSPYFAKAKESQTNSVSEKVALEKFFYEDGVAMMNPQTSTTTKSTASHQF